MPPPPPHRPSHIAVEIPPRRCAEPQVPPAQGAWGGDSALTSGSWTPAPLPLCRGTRRRGLSQPAGHLPAQGCSFPAVGSHPSTPVCAAAQLGKGSCQARMGDGDPVGWTPAASHPQTPGVGEMPLDNSRGSCCHLLSPKKGREFLPKQVLVFPSVWG